MLSVLLVEVTFWNLLAVSRRPCSIQHIIKQSTTQNVNKLNSLRNFQPNRGRLPLETFI